MEYACPVWHASISKEDSLTLERIQASIAKRILQATPLEVCSTMGESVRPSSFHNPTPSANKHAVQICRSSLSAAVQTIQASVEPRLSTALKDRSVVP